MAANSTSDQRVSLSVQEIVDLVSNQQAFSKMDALTLEITKLNTAITDLNQRMAVKDSKCDEHRRVNEDHGVTLYGAPGSPEKGLNQRVPAAERKILEHDASLERYEALMDRVGYLGWSVAASLLLVIGTFVWSVVQQNSLRHDMRDAIDGTSTRVDAPAKQVVTSKPGARP